MGRIRRKTFLLRMTLLIIIDLTLFTLFQDELNSGEILLYSIFMIPLVIIKILQIIQRLHDINKSGWYCILSFIPIINFLLLSLFFIDGTKGLNKYGKDPKGRIDEKKYKEKERNISNPKNDNIDPKLIDEKLSIIQDSLEEGLLSEAEFKEKQSKLIYEKEKVDNKIENENLFQSKKEKLKTLLDKEIISKADYKNKINQLMLEYKIESNPDYNISLNTNLFYIQRGKEVGPVSTKKIISLLNTKKISPNCLIRTEIENNYSKRASEISALFE